MQIPFLSNSLNFARSLDLGAGSQPSHEIGPEANIQAPQDSYVPSSGARAEQEPKATLTLMDFFKGKNGHHGPMVVKSARDEGFQGKITILELAEPPETGGGKLFTEAGDELLSQRLPKDEARQKIDDFIAGQASDVLEVNSIQLEKITASGQHHSAVNISSGKSAFGVTEELWSRAAKAWDNSASGEEQKHSEILLSNLSVAFEIDQSKLLSDDPLVHGPERQRLQQKLLNRTTNIIEHHPRVAHGRDQWEQTVLRFESRNNSVVIAAGNDGDAERKLSEENHGLTLDVPSGASRSLLENDEVTSVGATRWFDNNGQLTERSASFSAHSDGVDLYASSSVAQIFDPNRALNVGTSFAAPKVAAAMAELHRRHPELNSKQIESLLMQTLTRPMNDGARGEIQVLDYKTNFDFLHGQTY